MNVQCYLLETRFPDRISICSILAEPNRTLFDIFGSLFYHLSAVLYFYFSLQGHISPLVSKYMRRIGSMYMEVVTIVVTPSEQLISHDIPI